MVRSGGGGQTAVSHLGQDLSWSRQATESERERREWRESGEREQRAAAIERLAVTQLVLAPRPFRAITHHVPPTHNLAHTQQL